MHNLLVRARQAFPAVREWHHPIQTGGTCHELCCYTALTRATEGVRRKSGKICATGDIVMPATIAMSTTLTRWPGTVGTM